ncbi:tRNA pseudouridine synthase B [bioreactor metagenome]|uniref:tRNA pseudouridine(55) synthase n=1 Tax=bioreactor metagenome TaxID=1076179 RepID=A0A645EVC3_9ZZZZ
MANGILIVDKAPDWTSHDVVAKLRGLLKERRIGHGGTLDPIATGVLPVFVGRATRAVEFAAGADKEYIATLRLGLVTDTQDITGKVLEERPVEVTSERLETVLSAFRGALVQVPPMYSAIKQNGKKLYELARAGKEVERAPRPVTIHRLLILEQKNLVEYRLLVVCSKGTYVRTLCHDIGAALGCGGVMADLRRTRVGSFRLEQAITVEQLSAVEHLETLLLPTDSCFAQYPALTVEGKDLTRIRNGGAVLCLAAPGHYRVYDPSGAFLMLGRAEAGQLLTVKSFFEV